MEISGFGKLSSGEYGDLRISGCGSLDGDISCNSLFVSGSIKGDKINCNQSLYVSGCGKIGMIKADKIKVSGCLKCKEAECGEAEIFGVVKSQKNIQADKLTVQGVLACDGIVNAKEIDIIFKQGMKIEGIRCSKIRAQRKKCLSFKSKLNVKFLEADKIEIEDVRASCVSGKSVTIGKGCKIGLVQYTDSFDASPKAKIGKVEKI